MSDEPALLRAIFATPEEDTPRLAYADWLDEQGGEANAARAEYIRLEIDYAKRFPERRWSQQKQDARKRAVGLFNHHSREWFPELFGRKNVLRGARGRPDMGRGFPYRLLCDAGKLLDVGERLMQLAPIVEVEFRDIGVNDLRRLVRAPWVQGFRRLNLSGYSNTPDWAALAECPYLTRLDELVPHGGYLEVAGAARVAAADPVPNLRRLSVSFRVGDDGLAALFGGAAFAGLRKLSLSSAGSDRPYGIGGVRAVCGSPALSGLTAFDLRLRPMPDLTRTLTGATFWPGLEDLDLLRNGLGDDDLVALLKPRTPLRRLEFQDNEVTARGAVRLAEHAAFAGLTVLNLSGNPIGDAGLTALVASPHARNLRSLDVSRCHFGPSAVAALAESPHLTNLRELWVYGNELGLKAARALCASPHLGGLTYLYVGSVTATAKKELKARFGAAVC